MEDHSYVLLQKVVEENSHLRATIEACNAQQQRLFEELSLKLKSTHSGQAKHSWKRARLINVPQQCRVSIRVRLNTWFLSNNRCMASQTFTPITLSILYHQILNKGKYFLSVDFLAVRIFLKSSLPLLSLYPHSMNRFKKWVKFQAANQAQNKFRKWFLLSKIFVMLPLTTFCILFDNYIFLLLKGLESYNSEICNMHLPVFNFITYSTDVGS